MHCQPLGGKVVAHKENYAARREDGQEANHLLPPKTIDTFHAGFYKGPAVIVRKISERTEPHQRNTIKYGLVNRELIVVAGKKTERLDGAGVGIEAHPHQDTPFHHDIEKDGKQEQPAEHLRGTNVRPASFHKPHEPTTRYHT